MACSLSRKRMPPRPRRAAPPATRPGLHGGQVGTLGAGYPGADQLCLKLVQNIFMIQKKMAGEPTDQQITSM